MKKKIVHSKTHHVYAHSWQWIFHFPILPLARKKWKALKWGNMHLTMGKKKKKEKKERKSFGHFWHVRCTEKERSGWGDFQRGT
jgi:hypothetical protein